MQLIAILSIILTLANAQLFGRDGDGKLTFGSSQQDIVRYICMIQFVNGFDKERKSIDPDSMIFRRLFASLEPYWCMDGEPGGLCNIQCEQLLDNNLQDDFECAKLIMIFRGSNVLKEANAKCENIQMNPLNINQLLPIDDVLNNIGPQVQSTIEPFESNSNVFHLNVIIMMVCAFILFLI